MKKLLILAFAFTLSTTGYAQFSFKSLTNKASSILKDATKSSKKTTETKNDEQTQTEQKQQSTEQKQQVVATPVAVEDTFYNHCVAEIQALKDKWPSEKNWKGESVLKATYDVDKTVKFKLAQEFLKTTLHQRICQQSQIVVGKMHQTDNKVIKSRTVTGVSYTLNYHEDEYHVVLSKDYTTKKWMLEFTYHHDGTYDTPQVMNEIGFDLNGTQVLEGVKNSSAYCIIGSIASNRLTNPKSGLDVSDSSAQAPRSSEKNDDLGKVSSWDL